MKKSIYLISVLFLVCFINVGCGSEEVSNTSDVINKEAYILIYKRMGINNKYLENLYIKKYNKIDLNDSNTYVDFN